MQPHNFFKLCLWQHIKILEYSKTVVEDRFHNPQLQKLLVPELEKVKVDSKRNTPENFFVMLQTKATKTYPDPDTPAVAPFDAHAAGATAEQTRFDQNTARRCIKLCSRSTFSSNRASIYQNSA